MHSLLLRLAMPGLVAVMVSGCASELSHSAYRAADPAGLRKALTFHASFDRGTDADFATGDPWVYVAPKMEKWSDAKPGLPADGPFKVVTEGGRHGGALRFEKRADQVVYYRAHQNVPYMTQNWSGSVSFWLRTDFAELGMGFCDPVQLTPRAWNDASFFVEFEKRNKDVPFRLGAYADFKVWNPDNRDWGAIPVGEKPLLSVDGPPFSRDHWTHVVFTWEHFNTGNPDGVASLFLDGALIGKISARKQTFTWDAIQSRLMLGVGYVGWMDDVAVFNRALNPVEVQAVRTLPNGIRSLTKR